MARNPRRIAAQLDALYAELPTIDCQGLCSESCGPIPAGDFEQRRLERESGKALSCPDSCSMLVDRRCSVYDVRPMICRLWGVTEDLPCPIGCRPSRVLSVEEGYSFLQRAFQIAGYPSKAWRDQLVNVDLPSLMKGSAPFLRAHHMPTLAGREGSQDYGVLDTTYRIGPHRRVKQ